MKFRRITTMWALGSLLIGWMAYAQDLPNDAASRLQKFRGTAEKIQANADQAIKSEMNKVIDDLQKMQERYTKEGKLDEAIAIRNMIRQLKSATPDIELKIPPPSVEKKEIKVMPKVKGLPKFPPLEPKVNREEPERYQASKLRELDLPKPTAPDTTVLSSEGADGNLSLKTLKIDGNKIVGDMVWSSDGDAFFVLNENGVLSRIVLKNAVEEKRIDLARRCTSLAISAKGLLVSLADLQEVWVIDPNSLEVLRRIDARGTNRVLSGPDLNFALAVGPGEGASRFDGSTVLYINLTTFEPTVKYNRLPITHGRLTPDGKFYFAQGGIEQLQSFRIQGDRITAHQSTERIAQNGQSICVSPDSKYVCLPSGGGNYGAGRTYSTLIYPVDDLKKPELTLESGAYPRVVGFDPVGKKIFAQNFETPLIVYSLTGIEQSKHKLSKGRGDEPRQFVASPKGNRLLVLSGAGIIVVSWESK